MLHLQNYIAGTMVDCERRADIEDPVCGQVYATAPLSRESEVSRAMEAAASAFPGWRDTSPAQRQRALLRIADRLEDRAADIVAAECQDTGKPATLTLTEEIEPVIDQIRFFAGAARTLQGMASAEYLPGHTSSIRREPIGVIAQITPWNYPFMMAAWKWAPAIAAGNTVVLKPAETTPASTLLTADIIGDILPPGVINVICGDRTTGELMVQHPTPSMVAITGSVRAGSEVMASAAADLKNVHLELGGKAPAIVFADADIAVAAESLCSAAFFNAGQDCTAPTRLLIENSVYDSFLQAFLACAKQTRTGPGDADYGPLNSRGHRDRVQGFIDRLPSHADVALGGHQPQGAGYLYPPTVITSVRQDDEVVQQEIFGPVVTVQRFATPEEAITLANGVPYGLASSVWTSNHTQAVTVSNKLDFGVVWINTHMVILAELPHGGYKKSGTGKDLSLYGLEDYTRIKHVMSKTH
jgi:betaine-aldehyde dehydrogenase